CAAPGLNGAANRCGQYNAGWPCSCDSQCAAAGDCCADFQSFCLSGISGLSNASAYVLVRICKLADPGQ
ncbi:MAG: hypothetical protein VX938_09490, partial [Myxococcota bacterium]|nr:hypothetical protein [Myxococcota bacterium]